MRPRPLVPLAFVALAALAPTPGFAYCRSTTCKQACQADENGCNTAGKPLAWRASCVGVSLQRDGTSKLAKASVSDALDAALASWSEVPCDGPAASMSFSRLADTACNRLEFDPSGPNANAVIFRDDDWAHEGVTNTLAFTTVSFSPSTGEIYKADIEVNTAFNDVTTTGVAGVDLQSVLTHELGHLLGLSHSSDEAAVMFARYDQGDTAKRALTPDDTAGLCALYPPGRRVACDPTPRGGLSTRCKGDAQVTPAAPGKSCAYVCTDASSEATLLCAALAACALVARRRR